MACLALLIALSLSLTLSTEGAVVFRPPDVVELDAMLFIMDTEYSLILQDMIELDQGDFSAWINADHADMTRGSQGDFEWIKRLRNIEKNEGACVIPCANEDIFAMEVDVTGTDDDHYILENCVDLDDNARRPQVGFYCMNFQQRRCQTDAKCHIYMTTECQCPDFQVRYFCKGTAAERQQYCDNVADEFLKNTRSLESVEAEAAAETQLSVAAANNDADKPSKMIANKEIRQVLKEIASLLNGRR